MEAPQWRLAGQVWQRRRVVENAPRATRTCVAQLNVVLYELNAAAINRVIQTWVQAASTVPGSIEAAVALGAQQLWWRQWLQGCAWAGMDIRVIHSTRSKAPPAPHGRSSMKLRGTAATMCRRPRCSLTSAHQPRPVCSLPPALQKEEIHFASCLLQC